MKPAIFAPATLGLLLTAIPATAPGATATPPLCSTTSRGRTLPS